MLLFFKTNIKTMMLSWKLLVVDLIIIVLKPMKMLYTEMIVFSLYEFIWKSQQYRDIYTLFHFSHTFVLEKCFFYLCNYPAMNVILCHNLFEVKKAHFCLHCCLFLMEISTGMNALSLFRSEAGFVDLASIMWLQKVLRHENCGLFQSINAWFLDILMHMLFQLKF